MAVSDVLYSLGWQTIRPLLAAAGLFPSKLARALAGRREAVPAMRAWAARQADDRRPLLWLHGASAGELAGAAPVVAELRRRTDLRLVVTYSSPSGEEGASHLDPDYHGFVPPDLRQHTDAAVAALRPAALVFAKHDVWPNLAAAAERAGVPVGMINATVRPGSGRLRRPGRAVLRRAYGRIDLAGAVSSADRDRLAALGVPAGAIRVTGDASFDQAIARLRPAPDRRLRLPPRPPGVTRLIAGSTWPADEALLIDAIRGLARLELVLVPHEPSPEGTARLRAWVHERLGAAARVFSELPAGASPEETPPGAAPPPLIVDAVGFLAELYPEGDLAYVGGGLAGTGLHSVIEPAAAGLPVLFGPRHDRWEAAELVEAGAAFEVDETGIYAALVGLLDAKRRRRAGEAARAYVAEHAGADRRGADLVLELIG